MNKRTLSADDRLDLLNISIHFGDVGLHILLRPVQKIIIIPGVTHVLESGQQGAVFVGEDTGADIVLSNHTDSSLVGLGRMTCAYQKGLYCVGPSQRKSR